MLLTTTDECYNLVLAVVPIVNMHDYDEEEDAIFQPAAPAAVAAQDDSDDDQSFAEDEQL